MYARTHAYTYTVDRVARPRALIGFSIIHTLALANAQISVTPGRIPIQERSLSLSLAALAHVDVAQHSSLAVQGRSPDRPWRPSPTFSPTIASISTTPVRRLGAWVGGTTEAVKGKRSTLPFRPCTRTWLLSSTVAAQALSVASFRLLRSIYVSISLFLSRYLVIFLSLLVRQILLSSFIFFYPMTQNMKFTWQDLVQ